MRSTKLPSWIKRTLGFDPVPSPPHVFSLDGEQLRYGQFAHDRHGFRLRAFRESALPRDPFQHGPLGGPLRDPLGFREPAAAGMVEAIPGGVREASLVIPDAWLRVAFTESGELPKTPRTDRRGAALKLRRLVPFRVDELRVSATEVSATPAQEEPRRLLLGFAVEQLLAQIEEAFAAAGVRLGQISNASLALLAAVAPSPDAFSAVVLVGEEGYALIFARGGEPVLHRYKGFTGALPEASRASFVSRDLKLTRNFLDEHFPGAPLGAVLLLAPPELEPVWLDRLEEGLGRPATPVDGRHLPPLRAEEPSVPPWRSLAPMLGAARQEVA